MRRLGRNAAVAAVAAMTALLLMRNGKTAAPPACSGRGRCGCCALAGKCSLPAAEAARRRTAPEDGDA